MCSPELALGMQATGASMSVVSSYYGASMQKDAMRHQADLSEINAQISDVAVKQELQRGSEQASQLKLQAANMKSSQKAALAASGVVINEGSAKNILDSTDYMVARDIDTINANAVRAAFGQKTQSMNYRLQAGSQRAGATAISPGMQAATSLLGSAGNVATNWYMMNK